MLLLEAEEVERCSGGEGSLSARSRAEGRTEAFQRSMEI